MMGATVAELQARMSSEEFTDWVAYAAVEPFGFEVENFRAGAIASTVANVAPRKRGTRALKPSDFYPQVSQAGNDIGPGLQHALAEKRRRDAIRKKSGIRE